MTIEKHNFDAMSHEKLYNLLNDQNHGVAERITAVWDEFNHTLAEVTAELESAIRDSGVVWMGSAGDQFRVSTAPFAQWAQEAREAGVATRRSFEEHVSCYNAARHNMPKPVQVTSTANDDFCGIPSKLIHLVGGQTDQDIQERLANEAKRVAVRVMQSYGAGTASALDAVGDFVPPPAITTRVDESPIAPPPRVLTASTPPPLLPSHPLPFQSPPQPEHHSAPALTTPQGTTESASATPAAPQQASTPPLTTTPSATPQQPAQSFTVLPSIGSTSPAGTTLTAAAASPTSITSRLNPGLGSSGAGSGSRTLSGPPPIGGHTAPGGPHGPGGPGGAHGGSRPVVTTGAPLPTTPQQATRLPASATPPPAGMTALPPNGRSSEHDQHRRTAAYLEEHRDVWGADSIPKVSPPVIGDDHQ
ncbi:PPE domain-containing protein [Actinosynnema pretiosum subsp. pretiosum]|uniref:PPE domain-containing protein n=1 Tax=Actinosynnema pretiosum subsp. pretiosum TaxID=103721 RepID=A0AA45LAR8_9PSEU|nr:PPE domain-containing protein [Actinosynnema pretiosum subsp. pretiosum]